MQIDLMELLERAYDSGFLASGEGYNGEYPFDYAADAVSRELSERRKDVVENLLRRATLKEPE